MITTTLTLDSESSRHVLGYLAYVKASLVTVHGLVSDAALAGLLSVWADSALTIPTGQAITEEAARTDLVCDGPEVPLMFAAEIRPRAVLRAEELANASGLPVERIYLAAVRVGLRKFTAQIEGQKVAAA